MKKTMKELEILKGSILGGIESYSNLSEHDEDDKITLENKAEGMVLGYKYGTGLKTDVNVIVEWIENLDLVESVEIRHNTLYIKYIRPLDSLLDMILMTYIHNKIEFGF